MRRSSERNSYDENTSTFYNEYLTLSLECKSITLDMHGRGQTDTYSYLCMSLLCTQRMRTMWLKKKIKQKIRTNEYTLPTGIVTDVNSTVCCGVWSVHHTSYMKDRRTHIILDSKKTTCGGHNNNMYLCTRSELLFFVEFGAALSIFTWYNPFLWGRKRHGFDWDDYFTTRPALLLLSHKPLDSNHLDDQQQEQKRRKTFIWQPITSNLPFVLFELIFCSQKIHHT